MRELCEFRVAEEHAHLLFGPNEGVRLGDGIHQTVRKITLETDDPRFGEMSRINEVLHAKGKSFFTGCFLEYRYTKSDLEKADLFRLRITAAFEPSGEECGTVFDESETCPECGAGRKQISDLILDLRKAPKSKDIARTISHDEWIVTQRLAELMVDAKLTGFDLAPVRHKARYQDDAMRLSDVPSGRELYRLAKTQGVPDDCWEFDVWAHRPEQAALMARAWAENAQQNAAKARRNWKPLPVWYQLVVTSNPVSIVPPTRTGNNPFDDDPNNEYRCPYGHVIGWNLLSEVSVARESWDGTDVVRTSSMLGYRMNLLMPRPCLLISPRFYRLLKEHKIKGYKVEVAYLV